MSAPNEIELICGCCSLRSRIDDPRYARAWPECCGQRMLKAQLLQAKDGKLVVLDYGDEDDGGIAAAIPEAGQIYWPDCDISHCVLGTDTCELDVTIHPKDKK